MNTEIEIGVFLGENNRYQRLFFIEHLILFAEVIYSLATPALNNNKVLNKLYRALSYYSCEDSRSILVLQPSIRTILLYLPKRADQLRFASKPASISRRVGVDLMQIRLRKHTECLKDDQNFTLVWCVHASTAAILPCYPISFLQSCGKLFLKELFFFKSFADFFVKTHMCYIL